MGLILFAVLIFLGLRGTRIRQAAVYCVTTAALLTAIGVGALNDRACTPFGCAPSTAKLAIAFMAMLGLAFLCFGLGAGVRRLFGRSTA